MNTVKGPDSQEERIEHMVALYQLPLLRMCIMYLHRFSKTSFQRVQKARNMVRAGLRAYLLLLWILPVFIAFLPVKIFDFIHLLPCQFKIKYIEVLCDMIRIGGTVNGNVPILDLPAENESAQGSFHEHWRSERWFHWRNAPGYALCRQRDTRIPPRSRIAVHTPAALCFDNTDGFRSG